MNLLPRWLTQYDRTWLRGDLVAGLTVAVMLVPQAMAYAMLAGLPPVVGLYASMLPVVAYALLGSSRQLAVGPVAMVSLLVATAVGGLAAEGTAASLGYALVLAALVGVIQVAMGIARLGLAVRLLSHPVVSGFTSAAALVIAASQIKSLTGVDLPRSEHVHEIALALAARIGEVDLPTLVLGLLSVGGLWAARRWAPRAPAALIAVAGGTLAVWGLGLPVDVVGHVPSGLPSIALPPLDATSVRALLPTALIISLIGLLESVAVGKAIAKRRGYAVDPNRELLGLGAANLAAAVSGGYPVTGGFSRTAVNDQAGANTPLAGVITAALVAVTVLVLTPLFHHLPKAVLGAIIVVAVLGLVDVATVRHLWRTKRTDAGLLVLTFAATLGLGIEPGILVGVLASLAVFLVRAGLPHVAVLGRLPDGAWRNVDRHPAAEPVPGVLVARVDRAIWFANVDFVRGRLESLVRGHDGAVVLDLSGVNDLDASAAETVEELVERWRDDGRTVVLAQAKGPVLDVLRRAGVVAHLGDAAFAKTLDAAVRRSA